jgi:hypothetical protein
MPVFLPTPSWWAPQDQRQVIRFGGLPVPGSGAVMPWIDLNDQITWFAQEVIIDGKFISNKSAQLTWRGQGVWTAQDFVGRKIAIPMNYDEAGYRSSGVDFTQGQGRVIASPSWSDNSALLVSSGEQYLTFDGVYGLRVKSDGFAPTKFLKAEPPYILETQLEFVSRNPFLERIAGVATVAERSLTVHGPAAVGDSGWPVVYDGAMYAEPIFTMYLDAGDQTAQVAQVGVSNASTATGVCMNFNPPLPTGAPGHIFVFDSSRFSCSADGQEQPPAGDFPLIYPGSMPGFVNVMQFWLSLVGGNGTIRTHFTYAEKYNL